MSSKRLLFAACLALAGLQACRTPTPVAPDPHEGAPLEAVARAGDEILIGGHRFSTGRPVVLWFEEGGYDAYDTTLVAGEEPDYADRETGRRYEPGRRTRGDTPRTLVRPGSTDLAELARAIDQFVVHYDVCGLSRTCFRVLQEERGLSVHFLLDIDGTIYQTLDVRETAWHATRSNPRSVGVEIAHIGAWPPDRTAALDRWYGQDERGPFLQLPDSAGDGGVRTPGFLGRPARPERISGSINGRQVTQYDFTDEQYESLAALIATLSRALPRIEPQVPREPDGSVRTDVLSEAEWLAFSGVLGHCHVQQNKEDPGPAFDWERLLQALRRLRSSSPARG
jgi:N-acetylmuramoyl-L-alanine amidase